jgi:hypothetical protein
MFQGFQKGSAGGRFAGTGSFSRLDGARLAERFRPARLRLRLGRTFARRSVSPSCHMHQAKSAALDFGDIPMSDVAFPGSIEPARQKGPNLDGSLHPLTGILYMGVVAAALLFVAYSIYADVDATGTRVTSYLPYLLLFVALLIASLMCPGAAAQRAAGTWRRSRCKRVLDQLDPV